MPNSKYTNNASQQGMELLRQYLQGQQQNTDQFAATARQQAEIAAQGAQTRMSDAQKAQLQMQASNQEAQSAADMYKKLGLKNGQVRIGNAEVGQHENTMIPFYQEKQTENKVEDLSKRYEHVNSFNQSLQDLENITNRDGSGGVLTNPNAQLVSTGRVASAIPDNAMGVAELTGAVPKGSAEERKALSRLRLEYGKATAGMRQSDELRKQEQSAMGFMVSGDPSLAAKGVRALARNMKSDVQSIQAGYTPEVLSRVHTSMGNPLDVYNNVLSDSPAPKNVGMTGNTPGANAAQAPQPSADDQAAMSWLKANPNHPAAAAVAAKLKSKGFAQ